MVDNPAPKLFGPSVTGEKEPAENSLQRAERSSPVEKEEVAAETPAPVAGEAVRV